MTHLNGASATRHARIVVYMTSAHLFQVWHSFYFLLDQISKITMVYPAVTLQLITRSLETTPHALLSYFENEKRFLPIPRILLELLYLMQRVVGKRMIYPAMILLDST